MGQLRRVQMAKERGTLGQQHYSFWQAQLDDDVSYVYVIRGGKKTPVKIGVAKKPLTRLKTLQTGNPQTLRLLLVVPGGSALEGVLHQRFAEYRLASSEWFYGPGVAAIIEFITDLATEMVQAYQEGSYEPPSLAGFPGWTDTERERLTIHREPTIPMTEPSAEVLAHVERQPADAIFDFVPTIDRRIRGTMLRARQQNGPCTQ